MTDLVRQSPYTIVKIDQRGWVSRVIANKSLQDPTGYMENEAHFGDPVAKRENPVRLRAGYRLINLVALEPPYATDPLSGEPITHERVAVPWKYCKVVNYEVVEMDQAEKDTRDAEIAAEKAQQEQSQADGSYADIQTRTMIKCVNRRFDDPPTATGKITKDEYEATYKSFLN